MEMIIGIAIFEVELQCCNCIIEIGIFKVEMDCCNGCVAGIGIM